MREPAAETMVPGINEHLQGVRRHYDGTSWKLWKAARVRARRHNLHFGVIGGGPVSDCHLGS